MRVNDERPTWEPVLYGVMLAVIVLFGGCSRTEVEEIRETNTTSTTQVQGTIHVPDGVGGHAAVPVDLTVTHSSRTDEEALTESVTKADLESAIQQIAKIGAPVVKAATGFDPSGLIDSITGGGTMAGLGYLALKKRQQMQNPMPPMRKREDDEAS
jgi:hypothetical protein